MLHHADDSSDNEEFWIHYLGKTCRLKKNFQERRHPFDLYSKKQFKERYRLNKTTVIRLLDELERDLEYLSDRNNSVTPINQLLITLRFYATGTFQLVMGDLFGVDKSTCCRIIHKVTPLIAALSKKFITFPNEPEQAKTIMAKFYENFGFPGIIGAVDCTHVPIFSPGGESAEAFRNRKGYFSFNVQLVCDPDLYVTDVVARWPGSSHDSTIFDFSHIRARFENTEIPLGYLIGDSGYACRPYSLIPVPEPVTLLSEEKYNKSHVQARNCIERANGVIKRRFPTLKFGLRVKTEKISAIIVAVVVLHNIARLVGDSDPQEDRELSAYIDEKRKSGIFVDYEGPEAKLNHRLHKILQETQINGMR